jgi:YHS domain-containing protein
MFLTMVVAGLAVAGIFSATGLTPETRPTSSDVFGSIELNYKLVLNVLGLIVFAALFWLAARRGVTDPVCGMKVDREKALIAEHAGRTYFFCSAGCRARFENGPERYGGKEPQGEAHVATDTG